MAFWMCSLDVVFSSTEATIEAVVVAIDSSEVWFSPWNKKSRTSSNKESCSIELEVVDAIVELSSKFNQRTF